MCYFATASGSDFGKPPDDVQQLYRDKLRHIQWLRCSVETKLQLEITAVDLVINYVVSLALWLYAVLFG